MYARALTRGSQVPLARSIPIRSVRAARTYVRPLHATASPMPATEAKLSAEAAARAKAAVLGGFVADAAACPMHWIYDIPKLNGLLESVGKSSEPEFYPTPSNPFYKSEIGELSCYGHELVPLLRSMADKGELDADAYAQEMISYFSGDELYKNHSVKHMLTNWEAGKRGTQVGHETDHQANCFAKAALLVARYGGTAEFPAKVEAAIRVQQNNDNAVMYGLVGASILERVVVHGESVAQALTWAASNDSPLPEEMRTLVAKAAGIAEKPLTELTFEVPEYMKEMMGKHLAIKDTLPPFTWSVWCVGPACGCPASITNVLAAAAGHKTYVEGVRANLIAGGDNCSRGLLVGALLAAQDGPDGVPASWRERTTMYGDLEGLVDKVIASRG